MVTRFKTIPAVHYVAKLTDFY